MNFSTKLLFHNQIKKLFYSKNYSIFVKNPSIIYTEEHLNIQNTLRKIIDKEINPYIDEWEKQKLFPAKKIFKILGTAGIFGLDKPIEYGGLGLDYTYNIAVAEQIGAIRCGGVPMGIGVQCALSLPSLIRYGNEKLKNEYVIPTIAGDLVACLGISEISAGSDVAAIKTTAKTDGDDLIINGGKMWITNGVQADWMCLLTNTELNKSKHLDKSLVVLPMNLTGVTVTKSIEKMGMYSSDTAQIFFDNVRIPRSHIIGEPGKGFIYQMKQFQEERLFAVASSLIPLETVIKETLEYASQRKMYGKTLIDNQVVMFSLAEMLSELESLRAMLYQAVYNYTFHNVDVTMMASMAKWKVGKLSRKICDKCLQFWGGMGYTTEPYVNRMFRDMRLLSIGAGADEVMLDIISKYMVNAIK